MMFRGRIRVGVNKTKESATIVTLSFVLEAGLEPAQAFMPKGF